MTVLDAAHHALERARARLIGAGQASAAATVTWQTGDMLTWRPPPSYRVWHDRAMFHFLTNPADRATYVNHAASAVTLGGFRIVATFALDGPTHCSGLPVARLQSARCCTGPLRHQIVGCRSPEVAVRQGDARRAVLRLGARMAVLPGPCARPGGARNTPARADPAAKDWARLRACESSGRYDVIATHTYYGAYQFDLPTWRSVGGEGLPSAASVEEQDYRALLLYRMRGWQPWECAGILGLAPENDARVCRAAERKVISPRPSAQIPSAAVCRWDELRRPGHVDRRRRGAHGALIARLHSAAGAGPTVKPRLSQGGPELVRHLPDRPTEQVGGVTGRPSRHSG